MRPASDWPVRGGRIYEYFFSSCGLCVEKEMAEQPTSHLSARKQEVAQLRAERERQARAARDWAVQTKQEAERKREVNRRRTAARVEAARASARAEEAQRQREREAYSAERQASAAAKRAFDACDADGTGTISRREFAALTAALGLDMTNREREATFDRLDVDRSEAVAFAEFLPWYRELKTLEGVVGSWARTAAKGVW